VSLMSYLIASQIALWIALAILGFVCLALARQVGVLHQRIAPAGALSLRQPLKLGEAAPEMTLSTLDGSSVRISGAQAAGGRERRRGQLLLFISPDCGVCETLLPAVRSAQGAERAWLDIILASDGERDRHLEFVREKGLGRFPYVLSEHLGRTFGVSKLPYAALIDETGKLTATGLVNTREHLESLFVAKERGVSNIQEFLAQRDQRRASSGE
jgi:methylamine dehydrogenase accessory protein MauD